MRPSHRAARGQSVLELALSLMLFVTVLMYGIHFAEVGYLALKIPEAAISPLWDSTALRVHRMQHNENQIGDFSAFPAIAPTLQANAKARFKDFDGRTSTAASTVDNFTQVFTRMDRLEMLCSEDADVEFDLPRGQLPALMSPRGGDWPSAPAGQDVGEATDSPLDGVYENRGGVSCAASAHIEGLPTLPTTFLEGEQGFFDEKHSLPLSMTACSVGRAVNGICKGRYGILLGDFGFTDLDVSDHCPLQPERPDWPCRQNRAYYYAAMKVFDNDGRAAGHAATDFAKFFAGYSPIDENGFFMSYRGEEDDYVEKDTPEGEELDEVDRPRNTGGPDHKPEAFRRPSNTCFLGKQGC